MQINDQIQLFNNLFYVCLAIAALGLICSLLFYFSFDVPDIISVKTGRQKKKSKKKPQAKETMNELQAPVVNAKPVQEVPTDVLNTVVTAKLDRAPISSGTGNQFEITQTIVMIHTDESISG